MVALLAAIGGDTTRAGQPPASAAPKSFVICYNPQAPIAKLKAYDLIVVDSAFPPIAIATLQKQNKNVIGYLSLGKVHKNRPFLADIKKLGIKHNPDAEFADSFQVDVADPRWHKLVTDTIVPKMIRDGFDGVFLDDLDDIGTRKLEKHAVALIAAIRGINPKPKAKLILMANRGLEYLPDFAKDVDYSLLESCFALNGKLRPPADPEWATKRLTAGQDANPKLIGCVVDYFAKTWPNPKLSADQDTLVSDIRKLHAERALLSCVTTEDLQTVPPSPTPATKK